MLAERNAAEPELVEALCRAAGPDRVFTDLPQRLAHARGAWPVELKRAQLGDWSDIPAVVVYPANTAEVARLFAVAPRFNRPLIPYGGGSGIVGGTTLGGSIAVDLKRLNGIQVSAVNQTADAGAGVIGQHLEATLNRQGYTCGHFPQSINSASVGGMVATAAIGTFSGRYGKMDDLVVGLEAVLPSGAIVRTRPIPRRSVGPDLNRLFIGSEGTLAIITEATLKIWPRPETRRWAAYTFRDTPSGLEVVRQMMRGDAQAALVRLYDEAEAADRLARFGYPAGQTLLILGFEGSAGFVEWQVHAVDEVCCAHGGIARGDAAALDWYRRRFDTSAMLRFNRKPGGVADAIEVAASWQHLENVWRSMRSALEPLAQHVHCHFSHAYHAGGSVYVIFYAEADAGTPQAAIDLYGRCLEAALEACLAAGGSISHHHGVGRAKRRWMREEHGPASFELMRALKRALDPDNLLNPGALGIEAS